MSITDPPAEVAEIRLEIRRFFAQLDDRGRRIGAARCGVYAFFDYDGEPIYVGKTIESLSGRVGRHLTGRRSDAVAKFVLDPFEVLDIEVWPLFEAATLAKAERQSIVSRVERAVYDRALVDSLYGAVLNEKAIPVVEPVELPASYRGRIIPAAMYELRRHPDLRLARRAQTMANLASLISERKVGKGLRTTLLVQAQRVETLASTRLSHFATEPDEVELGEH
jgi:hypothetical protein